MKILLRIAVIAAVAALAAGCCKCRSYQKKNRRPLVGTEWQLIQLDGRAVKPEEGKFYVMFLAEENRFAGVGACNRLMGKYETTDKGALRIGPIASTMMACPGMEQTPSPRRSKPPRITTWTGRCCCCSATAS